MIGHPEGERPLGRHVTIWGNIKMDPYKEFDTV
jgi:hypothetical protein